MKQIKVINLILCSDYLPHLRKLITKTINTNQTLTKVIRGEVRKSESKVPYFIAIK